MTPHPHRSTLIPYTTLFRSLSRAHEAGVDSLPGTAAEILDDDVRWVLTKGKRSEEHTSELQSPDNLVCRLLLEKKKLLIVDPGSRTLLHPDKPPTLTTNLPI